MSDEPRNPYQYAIIRVVPRVERGECLNAGVVLLCRSRAFIGARTELDEQRLAALAPETDPATVRPHLAAIERIARGDPAGGPMAGLSVAGALPLVGVAGQHDHPAVGGPHRPDRRSRRGARAPVRDAGPLAGRLRPSGCGRGAAAGPQTLTASEGRLARLPGVYAAHAAASRSTPSTSRSGSEP